MDLLIEMKDENGDLLDSIIVYQDGSDSEGVMAIRSYIMAAFDTQEVVCDIHDTDDN